MDEYIQDFIRESEENITELNNSLLELEDDPDDEEAMDSIFRTAHTLKGNFAAMGFQNASNLAHAIEDLLDEIRQGRMDVSSEIMDHVFAGVDQIESILGEIEAHGESKTDSSATIQEIRAILEGGQVESTTESAGDSEADTNPETNHDVASVIAELDDPSALAGADDVFHARVDMGDSQMKGVDAMFVLGNVTDRFDLLGAVPPLEAIDEGEYNDGFDLFLMGASEEEISELLSGSSKVESASVSDVTDEISGAAKSKSKDGTESTPESDATDDADVSFESGASKIESAESVEIPSMSRRYTLVRRPSLENSRPVSSSKSASVNSSIRR